MCDGLIGIIKATNNRIELVEGEKPSFQRPYHVGTTQKQLEKTEIDKMLELDLVEATASEGAASILLVPKKCGFLRFCMDYRRLNDSTVRVSYPINVMDECIYLLGTAKIFSTLD